MFEIDTSKLKKIIFSRIFTQTTILKIFLIFIYLFIYVFILTKSQLTSSLTSPPNICTGL
jgi:hypothetical protein